MGDVIDFEAERASRLEDGKYLLDCLMYVWEVHFEDFRRLRAEADGLEAEWFVNRFGEPRPHPLAMLRDKSLRALLSVFRLLRDAGVDVPVGQLGEVLDFQEVLKARRAQEGSLGG